MVAWPLLWVLRPVTEVGLSESGGRQGAIPLALLFHARWNGVLAPLLIHTQASIGNPSLKTQLSEPLLFPLAILTNSLVRQVPG